MREIPVHYPASTYRVGASNPPPTSERHQVRPGSHVAYWSLMAFTFVLFVGPQYYLPVLGSLRIALLTAGLSLLAFLLERFARRKRMFAPSRDISIALCLYGWAIVTTPFSIWPGGTVELLTDDLLKAILLCWLLGKVVDTKARILGAAWALCLMSAIQASVGINQYLAGDFGAGVGDVNRIRGYEASPLSTNPNDLALTLNLVLPIGLALFQTTRRRGWRLGILAALALTVICIVVTFSRAGFLTLAIVFMLYLRSLVRRKPVWAILLLLLLPVGLLLIPSGYGDRLGTIGSVEADPTGSSQSRWGRMMVAASHVLNNPIVGAGANMDAIALDEEAERLHGIDYRNAGMGSNVHNVYLQIAVDLGIPGLALYVMLMIGCVRNTAFVRRRSAESPDLRDFGYLAEAIQTSLLAFAASAMFYPVAYGLHFYYFAGFSIALRTSFDLESRRRRRSLPPEAPALAIT